MSNTPRSIKKEPCREIPEKADCMHNLTHEVVTQFDPKTPTTPTTRKTQDHPWVIVNESCLSQAMTAASSCRHTTCYTGFLIDILHTIDKRLENLNNCTIQVETFSNLSQPFSKNDLITVVERGGEWNAILLLKSRLTKIVEG
ncbi:hypothetical protein Fcan01_23285 [Folsomia candida]|uniref:Uncharacterized protein n=1 Tax=Folsomia candida TaxID=158441 RepID=A0A226DBD8_FOLCA|nr:hypothetical protein Fcan01_23285 [Folsomia candida]